MDMHDLVSQGGPHQSDVGARHLLVVDLQHIVYMVLRISAGSVPDIGCQIAVQITSRKSPVPPWSGNYTTNEADVVHPERRGGIGNHVTRECGGG